VGNETEDRDITIARHAGDNTGDRDEWLAAIIDEVRISSIARSDDWIETEYNNQYNPGTGGFIKTLGVETLACSIAAGTITSDDTPIFSGGTATLTLSGYDGAATLQWQSSADNSSWSPIGGATSASYTTSALSSDTYYRVAVTNSCTNYSSSFLINVEPTFLGGGYLFRKKLTIDGSQVSGNLSNFPVLVNISDEDLANHALCSGFDIVFTDETGSALLDHDLESYEPSAGTVTAWVRMDLSSGTDKDIYMYFGNPSASDPSTDADQTWDGNFMGVWHFASDNTDVSSNSNDFTAVNAPGTDTGKIGQGLELDNNGVTPASSRHSLSAADDGDFDLTTGMTISIWMKMDVYEDWARVILRNDDDGGTQPYTNYGLHFNNARQMQLKLGHNDGNGSTATSPGTFNSDQWYYLTGTFDGAIGRLYVDGVEVNTVSDNDPLEVNNEPLIIGRRYHGTGSGSGFFDGVLDEARLSNIARSADWIATEYANQNDPAGFIKSIAAIETTCGLETGTINPGSISLESGVSTSISILGYESGAALQWQSTTDGCTWSNVSGATSSLLTTGPLTVDTKYRVAITNGCTAYSDVSQVTVGIASTGTKRITVSQADVYGSDDLINFPLLVSLTDNDLRTIANGGSVQNDNAYDINFEDENGTVLSHEIVSYNASTGAYEAWVQVPRLKYNADTEIFLNYGSSGVTDDPSAASTWNGDYLAVYHLEDALDATSNSRDLTVSGGAQPGATGQLGNAYEFNFSGTSGYLEDADAAAYTDGLGAFTMQAWVKSHVASTNDGFLTLNAAQVNDGGTGMRFDVTGADGGGSSLIKIGVNTDNTPRNIEGASGQTSTDWIHAVVTWTTGTDPILYVNGTVSVPTGTRDLPANGLMTEGGALRIGDHPFGNWDGDVDEVRLLGTQLSAGWIQTEYFNQDDPTGFITVADACTVEAGVVSASNTSANVNGEATLYLNGEETGSTIQWQISSNGADFSDISGSTTDTLNTGALTASRYYRVAVTGSCTNYSDAQLITVQGGNLAGYDLRKKITLTGSEIADDHTDFPVLVRIDSDADLAANVTNSNGFDIVFTEADGVTQVPHQLERFDDATGQLVAWVKTNLTGGANKEMYMYYGNSSVSAATEDVANTWNAGYRGVYHLAGNDTDAIGTGSPSSVNTATATGIIGEAFDFVESSSAYVNTAFTYGSTVTSNMSVSAWVNVDNTTSDHTLLGTFDFTSGSPNESEGFLLWMDNGADPGFAFAITSQVSDELPVTVGTTNAISGLVGNWHHVVGTWDGTNLRIYVNGSEVDAGTMSDAYKVSTEPMAIGAQGDFGRRMDGLIDEARFLNSTLDANWILTEYNNQRIGSTFMTLGAQEWNCGISPTGTVTASVTAVQSGETTDLQLTNYQLGTTLQWQSSSDGTVFSDIGGETAASLVGSTVNQDTHYRVRLNDGTCDAYSDTVLVNVTYDFVEGYSYRMGVTVPAANVSGSGDLTDFPLLVDITNDDIRSVSNGGHVQNDNGYELKFATLDGTDLTYESEEYDPVTGRLRAWVNIPTLSGSTNTAFYLYYGNCSAIADPSSSATWNSDFAGVYHMDDGGDQSDSKGVYNLTNDGTTSAAGQIGNSRDFEANDDDHLDFANDIDIVRNAPAISISLWMRPESVNGNFMLAALSTDDGTSTTTSRVSLEFGNGTALGRVRYGGRAGDGEAFRLTQQPSATITSTGNWHHVVGVLDYANDEIRIYIDGSLASSTASANFTATSSSNTHSTNGAVGAEDNGGGTRHFDGRIDELRILTAELTVEWIQTEYNNQLNPTSFITLDGEESEFQWTGANGTAWSNTGNWSSCELPSASTPIRIPDVSNGNDPVISGDVVMQSLSVDTDATISLGNGEVTLHGSIENSGVINAGTGTVVLSGSENQTISGNEITFNNLTINKSDDGEVVVFDNMSVEGTLALTSGYINLANGNLTMKGGSFSGGSDESFVLTTGSSCLRQNVNNTAVLFPLGAALGSYTPAILDNSGVADTFCISVIGNVFEEGESGSEFAEGVVARTWLIDEEDSGNSNVALTLQWLNSVQKNGFVPDDAQITHYNSGLGNWETMTSGSLVELGGGRYSMTATGIMDFSPFSVGSTITTLPIDLIFFDAERAGDEVVVKWATASEIDNDFFTIERGSDGKTFDPIATVSGQGNSNERVDYSHNDNRPDPGFNYYRLKQTDFDGSYTYSNVVLVQDGIARTPELSIYPNANDGLDFYWSLNGMVPNSQVILTLHDVQGNLLGKQVIQSDANGVYLGQGFEQVKLGAGLYLLKATNNGKEIIHRLIVQ
ncbi:MAG: DUF2341 domain-containing protein, partial [Bacteroidota bacterium]